VRTIFPQEQSYDAEVDYTLSVPQDARVSIRNASGDIVVAGVQGELRAESVSRRDHRDVGGRRAPAAFVVGSRLGGRGRR
jgi:hypothetical protein